MNVERVAYAQLQTTGLSATDVAKPAAYYKAAVLTPTRDFELGHL